MAFLVYVRDALRPDRLAAKVVFDVQGAKPELNEADRRAGVVASHELAPSDLARPLDELRRLHPAQPKTTARVS